MTDKNAKDAQEDITTVLAQVASDVVGELEMDKLLPKILETTMNTLHADVCSIYLKEVDKLKCVAGTGFAQDIIGAEYELGQGLTGTVAQTGKPYNIKSREQREELKRQKILIGKHDEKQWAPGSGREFRNLLALPLKMKNEILGVIKVENKRQEFGEHFTEEDLRIFTIIANVIALAIENAKSHAKTEEQSKIISQKLAHIAGEIVGAFNMQKLLDRIIGTTMQILHAEVCSIFLKDETRPDMINCVAGSGFAERIVNRAQYHRGEGFTGYVFETGEEFNIKNPTERQTLVQKGIWLRKFDATQWEGGQDEFRNLLALPLKIKDQIFGVIKAENKKPEHGPYFSEEDHTIFRTIANVIALTIENARLHEQIEQQLKSISGKAAHKINNQATNYDFIELMLEEEAKKKVPDKEELAMLAQRIGETTTALKRMISEFRQFGKPYELKKELNDINRIIQSKIEELQNDQQQFSKVIENFDPEVPEFKFDAGRFAESITELLKNANRVLVENKQAGNIYVTTKLTSHENKPFVKIIIEDDGPGFPKQIQAFMPFQTTNPQSTGLGLATVKELVNLHGGIIELVKSEKGTCFEIFMPIEER